jgi:5'-nucleotidase
LDRPLILLTNDDGIHSNGLWAAAAALESLGEVLVAAPEEEQSSSGRSMPRNSEGRIQPVEVKVDGRVWQGYAVRGSPAQAVQHAVLRIAPRQVSLVVSGINYGENIGSGVTISGTVGAALEAAAFGVPGLAVSLETTTEELLSQDPSVDFSIAAHFTQKFARRLLEVRLPEDVHVLKVEVPRSASLETPWQVARLSRHRYYVPVKPEGVRLEDAIRIGYRVRDGKELEPGSDARAMAEGVVAVTPLSLDMTSRVDGETLRALLNGR